MQNHIKSKIAKVFLFILLTGMYIASAVSVIVNLIDLNRDSINEGVISEVEYHTSSTRWTTGGQWTYFIKLDSTTSLSGQYNSRKDFNIQSGDIITYRRIDFSHGIRALRLNGNEIQNYYGFWDVWCLLYFLITPFLIYYLPKVLSRLKKKHNDRLIRNYQNRK